MTITIMQDTTRGATDVKVLKGTRVRVLAARQDEDGLKLLVTEQDKPYRPFQVRADDTNYEVLR